MKSRMPRCIVLIVLCAFLFTQTPCADWREWEGWREWALVPADPADPGPRSADYFEVTLTNPDTGNSLPTVVWFPARGTDIDLQGAPYPGLVFAHGFLATPLLYSGNGQQLATWGYVVAMPDFADERLEARVSDARWLLTYLEEETLSPDSLLHGMIDPDRLGIVGHSLGGLTTLVVAARDARVQAAVALDPVNPPLFLNISAWNAEGEGGALTAPVLVLAAPAQTCNYFANYEGVYPLLGAQHKAKLVVSEGNHCDFMQTSSAVPRDACYRICRGEFSEDRVALAGRYSIAWLNYYLRGDPEFYAYLYGGVAHDDVEAGLLTREIDTAPRAVDAQGEQAAIRVSWERYAHPIVDGYSIYRRTEGGVLGGRSTARLTAVSSYIDTDVVPGRRYYYVVRSRDAAGNEHGPSREVSAVALPD